MTAAFIIGLASVLAMNISVFMDDKGSYLMDYNLTQVTLASNAVDNQIQNILLIAQLIQTKAIKSDWDGVKNIFTDYSKKLKLKRFLVMDLSKDGSFKKLAPLEGDDVSLLHYLDQLGWDHIRYLNDPVLVGKATSGDLAIGTLIRNPKGGGTAYFFLASPDLNLPEISTEFQIYLLDSLGNPLFVNNSESRGITGSEMKDLLNSILDEKIFHGVKKWSSKSEYFLMAFRRLNVKELTVVGLIPDKIAFGAIQAFFARTILLGVSVILISIGFMLVLIKPVTQGLRAMASIIKKVSQGDFSSRIDTKGMGEDEIGTLATSFNLMAEKIDQIVSESSNNIEAKQEREILSNVNAHFIPHQSLDQSQISFSARSIQASLFGGDWWHYQKIGEYVIFMMGKADGVGLSSAMLTAAAHGAISSFGMLTQLVPFQKAPELKILVQYLNGVIYEATQGRKKMSCFISLIDTYTGEIQIVNSSFPVPYLHRIELGGNSRDPADHFEPLNLKSHPPLGGSNALKVEVDSYQLKPGDLIFWYSPGLLKVSNAKAEVLRSMKLFEFISELYKQCDGQAIHISFEVIGKIKDFLGDAGQNLPDDLTVGVMTIPKKATFKEREEIT